MSSSKSARGQATNSAVLRRASISVVLNAFLRTDFLDKQLKALYAQTVQPSEILVWSNTFQPDLVARFPGVRWALSSENLGVWARFSYALTAKSDFVCVLDDDTIPGRRWFENCLLTMRVHEGLLGTRGLRFEADYGYRGAKDFGWKSPNENPVRVDIVGHAWFFRREWLAAFWGTLNNRFPNDLAGEDIHFSYALQKELGLGTFVPPHPAEDHEWWGSSPEFGQEVGSDSNALSKGLRARWRFAEALEHYRDRGFVLLAERLPHLENGNPPRPGKVASWFQGGFRRLKTVIMYALKRLHLRRQ